MGKAARKKNNKLEGKPAPEKSETVQFPERHILQKTLIHLTIICLLGLIAYSNTFKVPFIFDDVPNIVDNTLIKDISNIPELLVGGKGPFASRAIMHATLAINYYFNRLDPIGYHAVNLGLHLINGALLYFLVMITGRLIGVAEYRLRSVAFFSSMLFVLHPAHTETVTNVVNRSMLLGTACYLLGMILFVRAVTVQNRRWLYIALLLFTSLAGMGSRESFITFPLLLFLYDLMFISSFRVKDTFRHWKVYLPVLISLGYLAHLVVNNTYDKAAAPSGIAIPAVQYVLTQFNVHWSYLKLLVFPVGLTLDYDYPIANHLFEMPTIFSIMGYLALWVVGILLAKRRPAVSFPVLWFLIALLPISFLVALMNLQLDDVIFEHRLYLPSAGLFPLATAGLFYILERFSIKRGRAIVVGVFCMIVIAFIPATYMRNNIWKSETTIWEDVVKKSPNKARGHYNLGITYMGQALTEKAVEQYLLTIELNPYHKKVHFNLGVVYLQNGLTDKARSEFEWAVYVNPYDYEARQFLEYVKNLKPNKRGARK